MAFSRSFRVVNPFVECCGYKLSGRSKKKTLEPRVVTAAEEERRHSLKRQLSTQSADFQRRRVSLSQQKSVIDRIDEIGELGASYYSPHTDILSSVQRQTSVALLSAR